MSSLKDSRSNNEDTNSERTVAGEDSRQAKSSSVSRPGVSPFQLPSIGYRKKPTRSLSSFSLSRPRKESIITVNVEEMTKRRKFILKLAKALLTFGAPSHRIESQLLAAAKILDARTEIVHLPNIVIVSIWNEDMNSTKTYFVRSRGRIALTSLHKVHQVYRDVLHDNIGAEAGTDALRQILRSPAIYSLKLRCFLAFICASIICGLSFGGSILDMWVSGVCACVLQYLGLNAANKSSMYANVYEISVSIIVAFIARALSNTPDDMFCYSAISSAGVVVILPGFTVLTSALELMSKNIFCGSVRIVYAIIYTLFLGFGLTIGSDFYLVLDSQARHIYYRSTISDNLNYTHGQFMMFNGTDPLVPISGVLGLGHLVGTGADSHTIKGCMRAPHWPWWRQPLPWWTLFVLVPIYSICSSLANLQYWRSLQLPIMVFFSCCAYAANRSASLVLPGRTDIVSAVGAFVIGSLGNIYSRVVGGTAFTSMVTGVLFLVPSGIAQGGGLTQTFHNSEQQYSSGFSLAIRMITVAAGVTIGLFVSQFITLGGKAMGEVILGVNARLIVLMYHPAAYTSEISLPATLKRSRSSEGIKGLIDVSRLPDLPRISGELALQVFTHISLRRPNDSPDNYHDNERLANLGRTAFEMALTHTLFELRPRLKRADITKQREKILSSTVIQEWVVAYNLMPKLRSHLVPQSSLKAPEEVNNLFFAYVGGLYMASGPVALNAWINGLLGTALKLLNDDTDSITEAMLGLEAPATKRMRGEGMAFSASPLPSHSLQQPAPPVSRQSSPHRAKSIPPNPLAPAQPSLPFLPLFNQAAMQRRVTVEYIAELSGPSHAGRWAVKCIVNGICKGEGIGNTKQVAKEEAARKAYYSMGWT